MKARDARTAAGEIICMRRAAGCTWTDYKANTGFAEDLNISPVLDEIQDYKKRLDTGCKQNVS
jgi:hypothetical protein